LWLLSRFLKLKVSRFQKCVAPVDFEIQTGGVIQPRLPVIQYFVPNFYTAILHSPANVDYVEFADLFSRYQTICWYSTLMELDPLTAKTVAMSEPTVPLVAGLLYFNINFTVQEFQSRASN
jgi:hypothetical protein